MKKFPIALQVYSVRDAAEKDFAGTMRKVKEMGYDGVELAGTYGLSVAEVKAILDQVGLELVSAHVAVFELQKEDVLEAYAATGMKYVAIPWMTGPETTEGVADAIAVIEDIAKAAKAKGMQLLYHNHDFEFKKVDGAYVLDQYYGKITEDLLKTELDTCWVNVGGEVPADYLLKYSGRAPVLHLKDFVGSKSENMYELIGDDKAKADSAGQFELRPVGSGKQDFPAILAAAEKAGTQWVVVEQDSPSLGKNSMECAQMSINYLKTIM